MSEPAIAASADPLSTVFAALAEPTRRDIVARLASSDATVSELAAPYDISVQAVSRHVRVLEKAGLVSKTADAQRRTVHLEAQVFDLMSAWVERYRRRAEQRYQRLDAVLAAMPSDQTTDADRTTQPDSVGGPDGPDTKNTKPESAS